MLSASTIREKFIRFFQERGHEHVRSSSLVPKDDPSLLFTSAGMVQFKAVFQGLEARSYTRAITAQKCLRVGGKHNDLENVGRTSRHHTFFEMLGNFSFGNYFKEEAIAYAWEFVTEELRLPKERLYVTVFREDDEALQLWHKIAEIPLDKIIRMGEKDNFWTMGDTGPCGPCSEIYIDQGEHLSCGEHCGIGKCECDRYLEIWNLVFMQYNQISPSQREPLPKPSVDTGMGLERISAVCQKVYSNFDSDLFSGLISYISSLAGVSYSHSLPDANDVDTALRVIADHSRAIAFMIADGILPSNEGRGYVLRRLIRRAYRFGILIGMPQTFLYSTSDKVIDIMGDAYPELFQTRSLMQKVVLDEERRFSNTLHNGLSLLEEEMLQLEKQGANIISGSLAFRLYDTYGFPIDIVHDLAVKKGFTVDEEGFTAAMQEQKTRAKAAWKGSGEKDLAKKFSILLEDGLRSKFVGYDTLHCNSRIVALLDSDGMPVSELKQGEKGYCVTGTTPFYGTSGGQTADTGVIENAVGKALVTDCFIPISGLNVMALDLAHGTLHLDAEVSLSVTSETRLATARNHSATHLLHAALQKILGSHVKQAGSLVSANRLRFDFSHFSPLSEEEIDAIEQEVNKHILADFSLESTEMAYDDAIAQGVTALFGEKYGDIVRVIRIDEVSQELCGGTHVNRSGQIGLFSIVSESGIAAGIRRIEAVTGFNALDTYKAQRQSLRELSQLLKTKPDELAKKVVQLQKDLKDAKKSNSAKTSTNLADLEKSILGQCAEIQGIKLITAKADVPTIKELRELVDGLRSKLASGVLCITAEEDEKIHLLLFVSKDLHGHFTAPQLIKEIAPSIGGSGGGRPDLAQAGGNRPQGAAEAFAKLKEYIENIAKK